MTPGDVWEPASFVLWCPNGHTWGSEGLYRRPWQVDLRFPECPFRGCGHEWAMQVVGYGPRRLAVIEPADVTPRSVGGAA